MPEYLAPGVYVEEISIGAKPIEGVSTSTAGFVGMTERGPLNKPTLVTSLAEYQRKFGGYLGDRFGECRFLPYAMEGFFANGGQRAYISRVADVDEEHEGRAKVSRALIPSISGSTTTLAADAKAGDITLKINPTTGLNVDDIILLKNGSTSEYLNYKGTAKVLNLGSSLTKGLQKTDVINLMGMDAAGNSINSDNATAKSKTIDLKTVDNLNHGDALKISDADKTEICVIDSVDAVAKAVTIVDELKSTHSKGVQVNKLTLPTPASPIFPISPIKANRAAIPIDLNDKLIKSGDVIRIGDVGDVYYWVKSLDTGILVDEELKYDHNAGSEIKQLVPAIQVSAADVGTWGDRIKIIVKESSISKGAKLKSNASSGQSFLDLDTVVGMEKGTILKLPTVKPTDQPKYVSVTKVEKSNSIARVTIKPPLDAALEPDKPVSTVEFDLIAHFDDYDEAFKNLSLDEDHSRYLTKIITPETSTLITVEDVSKKNITDKILLPTADNEPGWPLREGADGIPADASQIDVIYKGIPNNEPTERTGLYALENRDDISIAAIPGITSQTMQNELIIHCELMKDRIAVLDPEKGSDLDGVERQRNLHSSKYAAIYYPWISVFDPLSSQQIDVPPSGHICGIYARSDSERGVHKAPANEVVRGALDLGRLKNDSGPRAIITKGQQDVLNPMGINCIRAFPGRGILVWGARTISSDPSWKYVNIRRLFLFIEKSIDQGTQWVVFEPNDEKLWARVKQTITQFLVGVWKDGALMGVNQDDAFFVRCDRTTMTQSDIDNGRLIIVLGIAPVKPAEFVIFRIAQVAKGSDITA